MKDPLTSAAAPAGNAALAVLRESREAGALSSDTMFAPGIFLNADPALGIAGAWRSPPGRLLELDARMAGPGDWCAVHVALGRPGTEESAMIGIGCRSAALTPVVIRPCLRSGTEEGFVDCFFDRHILAQPADALHLDALDLQRRPEIPQTASWREIVLFLPVHTFRVSIHDLRLFMA